jgi:hypothetical protein
MLIKILELIYYKVVSQPEREKDLLGVEPINPIEQIEESPEHIAMETLDPLAERILRLVYLLIKQNRMNAERVTKYDRVIYMMLTRYDAKLVAKIFKETYKRAREIQSDSGEQEGGGAGVGAGGLGASQTLFGNVMKKWTDRLESISYLGPGNENLSKQMLYLSVISMMCRDDEGKGLYNYQMQAIQSILDVPTKVPITFELQKKSIDRPIVFINKRADGKK